MTFTEALEATARQLKGLNDIADIETCEAAHRLADEYGKDHVAAVVSLLSLKRDLER